MSPSHHLLPPHARSVEALLSHLETRVSGLTEAEAAERLKRVGENVLPAPPQATALRIFLRQTKGPFTIILGIAGVTSWALHDFLDATFIVAAIVFNVLFGFAQEFRAERALAALSRIIEQEASVIREGSPRRIAARKLVPGDIILLAAGERVPADARLIESESLEINEAPISGESLPVRKDTKTYAPETPLGERQNIVFAGTAVTRGEGSAIVIATGKDTEVGKIALMIRDIPEEVTPLEKRLEHLSRWITNVVLLLATLVFTVGISKELPFLEIFTTAAAVAVAAVPEGLIVAMTVILAIGMSRLVREHALVRKLRAAETLGSVTVICVDKTGTVTEGRMRVVDLLPPNGATDEEAKEHLLHLASLANEAWLEEAPHRDGTGIGGIVGEPTDAAILTAAIEAGLHDAIDARKKTVRDRLPFSSENQFVAALAELPERKEAVIAIKGAAERILPACSHFAQRGIRESPLSAHERGALMRKHNELSARGLRVIAVAFRRVAEETATLPETAMIVRDLVFAGFIALEDPVRTGVKDALELARKAGIKTILITGDHILTARAVAEKIGIPSQSILTGPELLSLSDEELSERLKGDVIFARTVPHDKLRIVRLLKQRGEVVAMTGDGINDAPAMKSADIGIAIGSGTEVAKASAELVLLDDDFSTIVSAIREGRVIFENIRRVVLFLFIDTFSEIILVLGSLLLDLPLPLLAAQILFVNLIEDGPPTFSLAFEKGEPDTMERPPRSPKERFINREMLILIFGVGILTDLILLGIYAWLLHVGVSLEAARTIIFAAVGLDSFTQIFSLRSLRTPIWKINPLSNLWLIAAASVGILGMIAAIHTPLLQEFLRTVPLDGAGWGIVGGLSLLAIVPVELVKGVSRRTPFLQR
jgi:Ca2+-transporting ATPase